ncbi:hypothetical protein ACFL0C_01025 [Patescibacteria group bacterium]
MREFIKITLFSTVIYFVSWLVVYSLGINSLSIQSEDTIPSMFLPVSIIKDKTLYADKYYDLIIKSYPHPDDKDYSLGLTPFYFRKAGPHYITAFPIISGLLALPIFALPLMFGMSISWLNVTVLSHLTSAITVGLSGSILFIFLSKHLLKDRKKVFLLTLIYLFGTINYALVSQALWQHGALQLFIILSLYYLYEKKWFMTGLTVGLAVLSRPTAIYFVPFVFLIFINQLIEEISDIKINKRQLTNILIYFFGLLLTFLFFAWYTKRFYLNISNNGYSDQILVNWLSRFPEGFLGLWLSPSKGILVYSPIFIFSLIGIYLLFKNKEWKKKSSFIYIASFGLVVTHTLILGKWKHWYGGWSFGYRMAADVIPFLIISMIPFMKSVYFKKYIKVFSILLVISVAVQIYGMIFFDGIWHAAYDLGFENTKWLWSIKDSELIFNIRRLLVKLGHLEKACPSCLPG